MMEYVWSGSISSQRAAATDPLNLSTLQLQQSVIRVNSKSQQTELIKAEIQVSAEVATQ